MTDLDKKAGWPVYPKAEVIVYYTDHRYKAQIGTQHPRLGPVTCVTYQLLTSEESAIKQATGRLVVLMKTRLKEEEYPKRIEIDLTPREEPVQNKGWWRRLFS